MGQPRQALKQHTYKLNIEWTGNTGEGTKAYASYRRDHTISAHGKPVIPASSDPAFRGDPSRYNPEELLVAALSSCHMLWYLHLCAVNKIVVQKYSDESRGTMDERSDGSGEFTEVALRPKVTIAAGSDISTANALHEEAHHKCFIANSVKFPVTVKPEIDFER